MSGTDILTANASGQTAVGLGAQLVTQIARIIGGESEGEIRAQALDCLNRVRTELNQHDWRFVKTTQDPITLVNQQSTYSLAAAFRKPSFARLIDAAALPFKHLEYEDDVVWSRRQEIQSQTGLPVWYTLRNDFDDGLIQLFPIPDLSASSQYRLQVEYYARIGAFADTEEGGQDLPEEVMNVLVVGGQAYFLRERDKASPVTGQAFADYQRLLAMLATHDRRQTEARSRFRPRTRVGGFDPTLYLKVN